MTTQRITRVFLDLDDVLNQFVPYVLWRLGCMEEPYSYEKYPKESGWNIVDAANRLQYYRKFTIESFWGSVTREMWANVPKTDFCDELIACSANYVGKENVFILTAPTLDPDCLAGKLEWIQRYCPSWIQRQYLIGPPKYLCAKPDTLLIDDRVENVDCFREAGGQGMLVPRPWNVLSDITIPKSYLLTTLESIFNNLI